jgi:hypothetical protein
MLDTVERAGAASAYQDDQLPDLRLAGGLVGVDAEKIETARLSSAIDSSPRSAAWSSG